ncbi:catalase-peroxidase [Octadecabacter temperatus]|uniref:Catalase-peroxidase n=1 Tax=Octadecabacter temperatus TaxID=1458307 RepID=A0A0K0Y567_9RHOB|nr:catalase/peroxidase HPI [Octadecabacter temperatus]AKS46011.1 Catalase-peroxidase [Octadecabacter temperatus]SIO05632.1 catalase-peroxidase [Octadecabacter temperatus]
MDGSPKDTGGKCPFDHGTSQETGSVANAGWWPNALNLKPLHQNDVQSNPMGGAFDYAEAFKTLDLDAVIADLTALMTDSQDWWPADYGHYGPFMIRMAWHSAGTYRVGDGRGGAGSGSQRFAPLNSWPDNGNLDKARRLLWPVKAKYGAALSWADLMILAGNVALESMGFETHGFAGGRADIWEPEEDIYWGPETEWLGDDSERYKQDNRELIGQLGAVQMGLIYVNPEGPMGNPDPLLSANDIRETFSKMAMNDEETVALVAGGHTFGKTHGAADPEKYVGAEPEAATLTEMGLGWSTSFGTGNGVDTVTSGLEGAWTPTPTTWDMSFFGVLFGYEWELTKSPAGAQQWQPKDLKDSDQAPTADGKGKTHIMMTTADMALRMDPAYEKISRRYMENPEEFAKAFAKAWYKLTHRDMGPYELGLGKYVPATAESWQDPVPAVDHALISGADVDGLKEAIAASGLTSAEMVTTAWASAASFRGSDKRGGANGARVRLNPAKDWEVNDPKALASVLAKLDEVRAAFGKPVSLADTIVLAGSVGVEMAAKAAGKTITVPFNAGRTDASQDDTDVESYAWLEPKADGFRNYIKDGATRSSAEHLVDRAQLLTLTAPEMTVLVGGLRVIGANTGGSKHGVLTDNVGTLDQSFFTNLLDMGTVWTENGDIMEGRARNGGDVKWTATTVDLVFGSNSILRSLAEVYASADAGDKFVNDFVAAWVKVMELDRFDLH